MCDAISVLLRNGAAFKILGVGMMNVATVSGEYDYTLEVRVDSVDTDRQGKKHKC